MEKANVAVFASGNGTNAERMFEYFKDHPSIRIGLLLTNNPKAGVISRAEQWAIPTVQFSREDLNISGQVKSILEDQNIDWIALAGFLWLLPGEIVNAFNGKIINIHPALLPDYGGKGMYGSRVHEAVLRDGKEETGITIHLVDEAYDRGQVLFQARCPVEPGDTPESLASRVHDLEYANYPPVLEKLILQHSS